MGFHFSTVYLHSVRFAQVRDALIELMSETERLPTAERGLEPTPDSCVAHKRVRSFALLPEQDGWIAILEDGQSLDDGGIAEGLSEILQAEATVLAYSDEERQWSYTTYLEGQPLEAGGADDDDFDTSALEYVESNGLPFFGVNYEEVAAAIGGDAPALAGSLSVVGEIVPRVPMGTEVLTFTRPGKALPT